MGIKAEEALALAQAYAADQIKKVEVGGVSEAFLQEQITNNPTVASKVTMEEVNTQVNELLEENGFNDVKSGLNTVKNDLSYQYNSIFNLFDRNSSENEYGCYYSNNEKIENVNNAESHYIYVKEGKKYCCGVKYQGVEVYDSEKVYLTSISANSKSVFTIPSGGKFIRLNMSTLYSDRSNSKHIFNFMVVEGEQYPTTYIPYGVNYNIPIQSDNIEKLEKPLKGKGILFFGDSITRGEDNTGEPEKGNFYVPRLIYHTGMDLVGNYAVWGACWQHSGDIDGDTETNNTLPNQVYKALDDYDNGVITEPNIIVLSAGTNNLNPNTDKDVTLQSQFIDEETHTYISIDSCNLNSIYGSIRWCVEKLYDKFPNAQIFLATPIQAEEKTRYVKWIEEIADRIINISSRLSCGVIDAYRNSGIYGRYEVNKGMGKYLRDGLHPNQDGSDLLAECYRLAIESQYKDIRPTT